MTRLRHCNIGLRLDLGCLRMLEGVRGYDRLQLELDAWRRSCVSSASRKMVGHRVHKSNEEQNKAEHVIFRSRTRHKERRGKRKSFGDNCLVRPKCSTDFKAKIVIWLYNKEMVGREEEMVVAHQLHGMDLTTPSRRGQRCIEIVSWAATSAIEQLVCGPGSGLIRVLSNNN